MCSYFFAIPKYSPTRCTGLAAQMLPTDSKSPAHRRTRQPPSPLRPQPYCVHYIIIFHDNAIFASYKRNKGQQYCQHRDSLHQLHHIPQRKVLRSKQHRQRQRQPYPAEGHGRQLPMAQSAAKDAGGGSQPYLPYPAAQQQRHQNVSALMERRVQENRRE